MTLRPRIVGRVGSIPTMFCLMRFAASIAFKRGACTNFGLAVVTPCLLPFIFSHFSAFCLEVAEFIEVETVSYFSISSSILGINFSWLDLRFCSSRFYFI